MTIREGLSDLRTDVVHAALRWWTVHRNDTTHDDSTSELHDAVDVYARHLTGRLRVTKAELEAELKQSKTMYNNAARENRELRDKVALYERFFGIMEKMAGVRRYESYGS